MTRQRRISDLELKGLVKGEAGSGLFAPWESDSDLRRHFRDGAFLHMIWPHVHWEQQISMVHVAKANSERAKGSF